MILDVSGNGIAELSVGCFNGVENASHIQFSHNKLKYVNHGWFEGLLKLEILNVSNNYVEHVLLNESFTPKLKELDLSYCRLQLLL